MIFFKNTHIRVDKAKVRLPLPHNGCMISHSGELGVKEAFIFFPQLILCPLATRKLKVG